jgi:hypothetical protein
MAKNPDAPKLVVSQPLDLPGGRKMKVFAYDNGEVRFELSDGPWVLSQCFLPGEKDKAIIKLSPGRQGRAVDKNWLEKQDN